MIHQIWFIMIAGSVFDLLVTGNAGTMLESALAGCEKAIGLTLQLAAGYVFFCGLIEIGQALKAEKGIEKLFRPLLKRLLPNVCTPEAQGAVALNLSMNILGLGNAATPMGLEAMRRMEAERTLRPGIRHDMYMLLILNATSLQLLPTTVLTMRAAAGSGNVNAVVLPTILCTAVSTLVGAALGMLCRTWEERKHG